MTNLLASLMLVAAIAAAPPADEAGPPFKITTKRDSDRVTVTFERDKAVFAFHSPRGISNAAIERAGEKWPAVVVLRLHLKGLEHFEVSNGKVKLTGSASLQDGAITVRLWNNGKEDEPLDANSPYWTVVRFVDGGGDRPMKQIRLNGGYFELALPPALFERNPKSITASWIDFYRN